MKVKNMRNKINIITPILLIAILNACGSETDSAQCEDSEANDQDNIIQRVKPGSIIGNLSYGVDMNDYYLVSSEGNQDTTVSVTNKSGMNLILGEVDILNQSQQSTNQNLVNEDGYEVETILTTSPHGYGYSTYIKVTTTEGSGEYILSIVMSPAKEKI
jgi:hypothetical protein